MTDRRSYLPAKDLRPPLGNPKQEAAKFLRDMANDFLKERSGENVVTEAAREWLKLTESGAALPAEPCELNPLADDYLAARREIAQLEQNVKDARARIAELERVPAEPAPPDRQDEQGEADSFDAFLKALEIEARIWKIDERVIQALAAALVPSHQWLWHRLEAERRQADVYAEKAAPSDNHATRLRALEIAQRVDDELVSASPPQSAHQHALTELLEGVSDTLRALVGGSRPALAGSPALSAATIHEIIRRIQDALPHGEHSQVAPLYPTWEAAVRIFDALRLYFEPPYAGHAGVSEGERKP